MWMTLCLLSLPSVSAQETEPLPSTQEPHSETEPEKSADELAPPEASPSPEKPEQESAAEEIGPRRPGAGQRRAGGRKPPGRAGPGGERSQELSMQRLERLRSYKSQRLELKSQWVLQGGSSTVYHAPMWRGRGWNRTTVHYQPARAREVTVVAQGGRKVNTESFLRLTSSPQELERFQLEVSALEEKGQRWRRVALAGGLTLAAGFTGQMFAETREVAQVARGVTWTGIAVGMTGALVSARPSSDAARFRSQPMAWLPAGEVEAMMSSFNEGLAEDLGMTAEELWWLEASDSSEPLRSGAGSSSGL